MAKDSKKREQYVIKVGPILKKALDMQRDRVKKALYGTSEASYYTVGEIAGKKLIDNNLV